jgi:hypothetical protein
MEQKNDLDNKTGSACFFIIHKPSLIQIYLPEILPL